MFNNKKNINIESLTIKNLFGKMKTIIFSYLKFSNNIMNYNNNKTNHWYTKKLKYMLSIYYYPKFNFVILKKDVPNSLTNNLNKKPL